MKQNIISTLKIFFFLIPLSVAMAGEKSKGPVQGKTEAKVVATININVATAEELTALPKIGPAIAARIIEFRETHKGFQKLEDLMNVKGIGPKTFEGLKGRIALK